MRGPEPDHAAEGGGHARFAGRVNCDAERARVRGNEHGCAGSATASNAVDRERIFDKSANRVGQQAGRIQL